MVTQAPRRRGVTSLAGASILTGVLAYVFFAVSARALGPTGAAPVSVLWTWWGLTGAAVTFPLQHWITRTAVASGGERAGRAALPRLAIGVLALAVGSGGAALLARERLFGDPGVSFPLLVAAVTAGAGLLGLVRGQLTARHQLAAVGAGLVLENAIRCLGSIALAVAGVDDPRWYGAALVLGYASAGAFPTAFRWHPTGRRGDAQGSVLHVGAAASGQLLAQVALTGGPVVLAVSGGSPAHVTALFAALALFRAPYTVATGLMAAVTGRVTRLWVAGSTTAWRRGGLTLAGAGTLALATVTPVAGWAGPWAIGLVFGSGVAPSGRVSAWLAAGTVLALLNLVLAVVLVAQQRGPGQVVGWLVGFAAAAGWLVWRPATTIDGVCELFVLVESVALVVLAAAAWTGVRRQGAVSDPA